MKAWLPRSLMLGVALTSLLTGCDQHRQDEPPPPVRPVLSLLVAPSAVRTLHSFTGTVEPRYQAQLGFQITGRMISREANVGDHVAKGQRLATLDPTLPRLAVTSAQGDLANAQAQLVNAAATFARQQELLKTQSVSQSQFDAAIATRDTAQAKVDQSKASLAKAKEQFGYTTLNSDYDGVVASWSAEVGQIVSTSQTVVTLARPDVRDAVFDVPDRLLARFAPSTALEVHLLADDDLTVEGQVREIGPQSDAATRTRRIRLTLVQPGEAFRLGTTVRVGLSDIAAPTIRIPRTSVLDQGGKVLVWLVGQDGTVATHAITLGPADGTTVAVVSGLSQGDRLVTAGVHSLSEGQAVKLATD